MHLMIISCSYDTGFQSGGKNLIHLWPTVHFKFQPLIDDVKGIKLHAVTICLMHSDVNYILLHDAADHRNGSQTFVYFHASRPVEILQLHKSKLTINAKG